MFMTELRFPLAIPRSRASLAARLRAISAARLAFALLLGHSMQPITTEAREARQRFRPSVTVAGAAVA